MALKLSILASLLVAYLLIQHISCRLVPAPSSSTSTLPSKSEYVPDPMASRIMPTPTQSQIVPIPYSTRVMTTEFEIDDGKRTETTSSEASPARKASTETTTTEVTTSEMMSTENVSTGTISPPLSVITTEINTYTEITSTEVTSNETTTENIIAGMVPRDELECVAFCLILRKTSNRKTAQACKYECSHRFVPSPKPTDFDKCESECKVERKRCENPGPETELLVDCEEEDRLCKRTCLVHFKGDGFENKFTTNNPLTTDEHESTTPGDEYVQTTDELCFTGCKVKQRICFTIKTEDFQETLLCMQACSDTCLHHCKAKKIPAVKPTTKRILSTCLTECKKEQVSCLEVEYRDPIICVRASNLCKEKCNRATTMLKRTSSVVRGLALQSSGKLPRLKISTSVSDTRQEKLGSLRSLNLVEWLTKRKGRSSKSPISTATSENEERSSTATPRLSTPSFHQSVDSNPLEEQCLEQCRREKRICWVDWEDSTLCFQLFNLCNGDY
ncbi:uncharacterized protein [Clytia hemisphaerica]|uniref:uncharacterized protein n=1 Tax=Clytia hemisphaerica TaxID=252671 RepID=UPI0034D481FE